MVLGRRRPERRRNGWQRRFQASRDDSLHGEDEDDEAELMAALACFGAAGFDGELDGDASAGGGADADGGVGGRLRDEPLGQRVEEGEAEGLVRFDLLCVAPIDGDERRAARASRPWRQCEQREREEAGEGAGEQVSRRESEGGLGVLIRSRGSRVAWHQCSVRRRRARASEQARVRSLQGEEEGEKFQGAPCLKF